MNIKDRSEIILRKDREWKLIDGELCLATNFRPLMGNIVKEGLVISRVTDVPYASIDVKTKRIKKKICGYITHKQDFANLWSAVRERGINEEKEEVLIYWSTNHYNNVIAKLLSKFLLIFLGGTPLPKIIVMVCQKGTYESCADGFSWPLEENARVVVYGLMSLSWWIPDIMK